MKNDAIISYGEGVLIKKENIDKLLVSFGGINQGLGMPPFEFFKSLEDIECDKVFIRDSYQMWYQNGIDSEIHDILKLRDYLKKEILNNKYKKICFLGNSMGGYAAILFGTMLNVDTVISFAPQTFINKKQRYLNFDFRWNKQINNVHKNKNRHKELFDLKNYLLKNNNYKSKIIIYYSEQHRLDRLHASRLKNLEKVNLITLTEGGHNAIKYLRDSGELIRIIKNELI